MDESAYRFLGLMQKAGKTLSGNLQLADGLKKGNGVLLLIAEDASDRTKEEYRRAAENRHIPCRIAGEKGRLGRALGKGERSAVLITDRGFAKALEKKLASENK